MKLIREETDDKFRFTACLQWQQRVMAQESVTAVVYPWLLVHFVLQVWHLALPTTCWRWSGTGRSWRVVSRISRTWTLKHFRTNCTGNNWRTSGTALLRHCRTRTARTWREFTENIIIELDEDAPLIVQLELLFRLLYKTRRNRVVSCFFYRCEVRFLTLKEEYKLNVFENRFPNKIYVYGPKKYK